MIQEIENQRCCGNCRFFNPEGRECRRNPPQVWADETDVGYCFPRVNASKDWCGEFQPKEQWVLPKSFDADGKIAKMIDEIRTEERVLKNEES